MQTQSIRRLSIPMDEFGIGKNLLDDLSNQPKRVRKTRFNKLRKFLVFAELIGAKDTVHSISKGLDAAGNLTIEVAYEEARHETVAEGT